MFNSKKLTILLTCLTIQTTPLISFAYDAPRTFLWGLAGDRGITRVDFMLPLLSNQYSRLFYTDFQGKLGSDDAYDLGGGVGYRGIAKQRIYGGYLFYDKNYSIFHDSFYSINPGLETIGARWDFRINGYFPRDRHRKSLIAPPTVTDTCGSNVNTDLSIFIGHQQFVQQFARVEEVGPGGDAEIGVHFPRLSNASIYGGGYHYSLKETRDINGAEARMVVPFNPRVGVTVEASYDNQQHRAIVGGLRIQLGHESSGPATLTNHLYDPIQRNLGTVKTGSGLPVVTTQKAAGLALIRDNIFFFNGGGGATFTDASTGTIENPLSSTQFTQTTVDGINAIAPNANLFFNTGTYTINPGSVAAPNSIIDIPGGQSLHGRTPDYRASANGSERPEFLGGIELLAGNNSLDSIILTNSITGVVGSSMVALSIQDADPVHICNSVINAESDVTGNFTTGVNSATALNANGTIISVDETVFNAMAMVTGSDLGGFNCAAGIGSITTNLSANTFDANNISLSGCAVNSMASVGGTLSNTGNLATGIGLVTGASVTPISDLSNHFDSNNFIINNTAISAQALAEEEFLDSDNLSVAIGIASIHSLTGPTTFNANTITLTNAILNSNSTTDTCSGSLIDTIGIGCGSGFMDTQTMEKNQFNFNNTSVNTLSLVIDDATDSFINTIAIGNTAFSMSNSTFSSNIVNLTNSALSATTHVEGSTSGTQTFAITIGNVSSTTATTCNFTDNTIQIDPCVLQATSQIEGNQGGGENEAISIGTDPTTTNANFADNSVTAFSSTFDVTARIGGTFLGTNKGLGFFANSPGLTTINNSFLTLTGQPLTTTLTPTEGNAVTLNNTTVTTNLIP